MLLKSNSHVCVCEMVPVTDKSQEQAAGLGSTATIASIPWGNVTIVAATVAVVFNFLFFSSNIFGDELNRGNATKSLVAMQWTLSAALSDNPQGLGFLLPSTYGCIMFGPN